MAAFVHIHIPSEASFPFYAHGHCVLQLTTSTSQAADSLFKSRHQEFLLQRIAITGTLLPQYMASWWLSLADMSSVWYSRSCSDSQSNILILIRCFSIIVGLLILLHQMKYFPPSSICPPILFVFPMDGSFRVRAQWRYEFMKRHLNFFIKLFRPLRCTLHTYLSRPQKF